MCTALDMPCGARGDFYHIESQSDISNLHQQKYRKSPVCICRPGFQFVKIARHCVPRKGRADLGWSWIGQKSPVSEETGDFLFDYSSTPRNFFARIPTTKDRTATPVEIRAISRKRRLKGWSWATLV